MQKGQSNLFLGGLYALTTAVLLATQAPLSFLAAKQLGVAEFIAVTELVLLLCVPFMIRTPRSREHFVTLLSSASYVAKFAVLLLIGLIGIVLYAFGLGRGHPIVIAAALNLDPFWAAVIAYLIAGKRLPTSFFTFALCLIVSFGGAMLLAVSSNGHPIHWSADVRFWLISGPRTGTSGPGALGSQRHLRRQMVFRLR